LQDKLQEIICVKEFQRHEIITIKDLFPLKTKLYSFTPKPSPGFRITMSIVKLHPAEKIYPKMKYKNMLTEKIFP
jgi:hypothetical protein